MSGKAIFRWLATLIGYTLLVGAVHAEPKKVLVLLQHSGAPAASLFSRGVEDRFRRTPTEVELFVEAYDANRFPSAKHAAALAEFLRSKYADISLDLVIAAGPQALALMESRDVDLWPGVAVVFAAVRESNDVLRSLSSNTTGFVNRFDVENTLDLALALQPDANRVVFVSGVAPLDAGWRAVADAQFANYKNRLEAVHLTGRPLEQVLEEVARLPSDTIVIFLTMIQDGAGQRFLRMDELSARIAEASSAPVYGVYETYIGRDIVGGYVDRFEPLGAATATLALRILAGDDPRSVPPERITGDFIVDWRQLRRWKLDASRLPADTIVMFKEPPVWDQYRMEILGVMALVALQTSLIAALSLRARKRSLERALRESEDRYRNVVESQTDLICRYLPDTTLTFVNEAYCGYFGRRREELVGTRFIELIPEDKRDEAIAHVRSLLADPRTVTYEHQVLTLEGSTAWQQWTDHVIVDAPLGIEIQGIGRDITQQKAAEREAQQRREEVIHLTRVAILGELSGALAHELNQPLTAILTNAQAAELMLVRKDIDLTELREILEDIVLEDVRAGAVISRLRAMLKRGATEMQPLDMNTLSREMLSLARSQLVERNVAVLEELDPALPHVLGDKVQLQQVLLNLLMNASEALETAEATKERRVIIRTASKQDGALSVSIIDNGPGLAPETQDQIFERFFTTKANGLGLGLSICRSIIAAHGGQLFACNNASGGTTVEFILPAHLTVAARASSPSQKVDSRQNAQQPSLHERPIGPRSSDIALQPRPRFRPDQESSRQGLGGPD